MYAPETLPINLSSREERMKLDFVKHVVKYLIVNLSHIESTLVGSSPWPCPCTGGPVWLCRVCFDEGGTSVLCASMLWADTGGCNHASGYEDLEFIKKKKTVHCDLTFLVWS